MAIDVKKWRMPAVSDHRLLGLPFRIDPSVPSVRMTFGTLGEYVLVWRVPESFLETFGLTRKQRQDIRRQIEEKGEARVKVTVSDEVAQRVFGEPQGFLGEMLIHADEARPGQGARGGEGGVADGQGGA